MKKFKFLSDILRDKNGYFNLRETVTALFVVVIIISWIAQQFLNLIVPEFMFYSFVSIVGAGCFGYSIERKQKFDFNNKDNENPPS